MDQTNQLSLDIRQEVFRCLVERQDNGVSVAQSRSETAAQFSLSAEQIQQIEREGSKNSWPPLS